MSSNPRINLPKEACHSLFFFCFFFVIYTYLSMSIYNMYIFRNIYLLIIGLVSGSAEQPQPALNGKALSQPRPHPSDRIV